MTYYNENDPYAAQWLRNLIAAGELPDGHVDDRSITDVQPEDLDGYTQVHFFAGIGGWPYALRLAGWPDDRPVWTGSCPCQPLSSAGHRKGHADRRHLWPAFHRLIAECRPATVLGEQVASKDGREWFSAVRADLECSGYACGCADLAAASVGAPHIRQRLFWVADAGSERRQQESRGSSRYESSHGRQQDGGHVAASGGEDDRLADATSERWWPGAGRKDGTEVVDGSDAHGLANADIPESGNGRVQRSGRLVQPAEDPDVGGLDDAAPYRRQHNQANAREYGTGDQQTEQGEFVGDRRLPGWGETEHIPCADGKTRVTQPGLRPLAHGIPNRVGKLRAYGNAIVPQVAAEFIGAYIDAVR